MLARRLQRANAVLFLFFLRDIGIWEFAQGPSPYIRKKTFDRSMMALNRIHMPERIFKDGELVYYSPPPDQSGDQRDLPTFGLPYMIHVATKRALPVVSSTLLHVPCSRGPGLPLPTPAAGIVLYSRCLRICFSSV